MPFFPVPNHIKLSHKEKGAHWHCDTSGMFCRELFAKEDGTIRREGDIVHNLKLGNTLRRIAADPYAFYNGSLAQDIVEDIAELGGNITLADLQGYQVSVKPPLNVTLQNGNYTMHNPPPPSGGAILDFIMNILDG